MKAKDSKLAYRGVHHKPGDGGAGVKDTGEALVEGLGSGCHSSPMMQRSWGRGKEKGWKDLTKERGRSRRNQKTA